MSEQYLGKPSEYRAIAAMGLSCDSARRAFKRGFSFDEIIELQRETGLSPLEELGAWRPLDPTEIVDPAHILPMYGQRMIPVRRYGPGTKAEISRVDEVAETAPIELTVGTPTRTGA